MFVCLCGGDVDVRVGAVCVCGRLWHCLGSSRFFSSYATDARRVSALSSEQLLLQATHLRNTEFVYGIAVYTGNETKFGNNKKTPAPKLTKTDRIIDRFSAYIFVFQVCVCVCSVAGRRLTSLSLFTAVPGGDLWHSGGCMGAQQGPESLVSELSHTARVLLLDHPRALPPAQLHNDPHLAQGT